MSFGPSSSARTKKAMRTQDDLITLCVISPSIRQLISKTTKMRQKYSIIKIFKSIYKGTYITGRHVYF